MPYNRPTLPELAQNTETDLAARLGAMDALRRKVVKVLARVWAGLAHGLYGYINELAKQLMPFTATGRYLELHAAWWGIYRKPAARAVGQAILTGTANTFIPAGTVMRAESGQQYQTQDDARIESSGRVSLTIRALIGGGEYDLPAGTALRLISPISGLSSDVTAGAEGITGGAAAEDDVSLRARFLERVQFPPQGGTENDYRQWALAVPGVTRAWAYGNILGPGTVGLTFVRDGADNIIPTAEQVAEVQEYLDDPIRKPVTADVIVYAPIAVRTNLTIKALEPDRAEVKEAVTAELAALFAREAVPGGKLLISHVREAISLAVGEYDHVLISPTANIAAGPNRILVLGSVNFVS